MKKCLRKIGIDIFLLLSGTLIGLAALIAVFCLPVDGMRQHTEESVSMLQREFVMKEIIEGFHATLPGTFTDCLMLQHAIYEKPEHSMLKQILYMYRAESGSEDAWMPGISLVDYLEGKEAAVEMEYARYWHGYLVFLKPLLALTTFNAIRVIAAWLQLLLLGLVVIACMKRGEEYMGKAFLLSMPFMYFFSQYFSLSLSICFYIMAIAMLVQLKCHEQIVKKNWYGEFFLIVGMATSYFDFLTYPLVTLGFPLCVYLYLKRDVWQESIKKLIQYSFEWGVGYAGLWLMKWITADVLVGSATIADGMSALFERTDAAENQARLGGFVSVVLQNFKVYRNWAYVLLVAGIAIWLLLGFIKKGRYNISAKRLSECAVLLLVALYPLGWFFVAQNHSQQHWMFTCRILALSAFAGLCAAGRLFEGDKGEGKQADLKKE